MQLIQVTEEKIDIDDPYFGEKKLLGGNIYLVHDLVVQAIVKREWGKVVGNGKNLRHLSRTVLQPKNEPLNVLFLFHGGLGDAIFVAILFELLEKEYNLKIDVACRYDTWHYVFAPMDFGGRRVDFPVEMEIIDQYDYIQTDVTNFVSDQPKKWDRPVPEVLATAYKLDTGRFHGTYTIPDSVMCSTKLPESKELRIGVNFDSIGEVKSYPDELANQLILDLIELDFEVYRFGTQQTGKKYDLLADRYHDYTGRTNIFELASLLKQMHYVIGVDSFPIHLSNILGVRSIVLLSTTTPELYRYHRDVMCIASKIECSPCGAVRKGCPEGYEQCRAFYHESVSPDQIKASMLCDCKKLL